MQKKKKRKANKMGKRKEEINGKNDLITKRIKKKKESEK